MSYSRTITYMNNQVQMGISYEPTNAGYDEVDLSLRVNIGRVDENLSEAQAMEILTANLAWMMDRLVQRQKRVDDSLTF